MTDIRAEIDHNGQEFRELWRKELQENIDSIGYEEKLIESYRRITAIQAVKVKIVEESCTEKACNFFSEAHNDSLTSHVFASFGAWRSALQALRSSIENILCCFYYSDHPVELELWEVSDFRIGFSELFTYFQKHPKLAGTEGAFGGLEQLKKEYATLSKAVHASAPSFRMTDPAAKLLLWSDHQERLSMWSTREKKTVEASVLLAISLYREKITGTKLTDARSSLAFALSDQKKRNLRGSSIYIG